MFAACCVLGRNEVKQPVVPSCAFCAEAGFAPAGTRVATSKRPVYAVAVRSHFKASFCIGTFALGIAQKRPPNPRNAGSHTSVAMALRQASGVLVCS